jgi:hypothetical protein
MTREEKLAAKLERARRCGYIVTDGKSEAYDSWELECGADIDNDRDFIDGLRPFIAVLRNGGIATVELRLDHLWGIYGNPTTLGAAKVLADAVVIIWRHHRRWFKRWANDPSVDNFPGGWQFDPHVWPQLKVFDVPMGQAIRMARRFAAAVVAHRDEFAIRLPDGEPGHEGRVWSARVKEFLDARRDADGNVVPTAEHLAAERAEHPNYTDKQIVYLARAKTILDAYVDYAPRPDTDEMNV